MGVLMYWLVFGLSLLIVSMAVYGWRSGRTRTDLFASDFWLGLRDAAKAGLFERKGVPLGDWGWSFLPVNFSHDGHILTVAPPGGGKTSTASIPSALSRGIKSRFIADPEGEISAVCIGDWRKSCDHVYVINPFGLHRTAPHNLPQHRFNPMAFIDVKGQGSGLYAARLASALITQSQTSDDSTAYFKSQGGEKLQAYIIYGALHGMTLPQVADLMALPIERSGFGDDDTEDSGITCQIDLWNDMREIDVLDGLLRKEADDLIDKLKNSAGEFQAIFSTMKDAVKFLKEPRVREALSGDDVDWEQLKKGRTVISLILPVRDFPLYAGFVRLAFMSAIMTLEQGEVSPHHVHILLEEFASLGRLPFFSELLATSRKKKAQVEIVLQNIKQLKTVYSDYEALMPNFEVRRLKKANEMGTADHFSRELGQQERVAKQGRYVATNLRTAFEIKVMKDNQQIVFIGNLRPALLGNYAYWDKRRDKSRALPNPNYKDLAGNYIVPVSEYSELPRWLAGKALRVWAGLLNPSAYALIFALSGFIWCTDPAVLIQEQFNKGRIECTWMTYHGQEMRSGRLKYGQDNWCRRFSLFHVNFF